LKVFLGRRRHRHPRGYAKRRFASTEKAVQSLNNPGLRKMMTKLSESQCEQATAEIRDRFRGFKRPDGGLEMTGEVLIAGGTK
jgi:hypothetical protein